ncbi:MAG: sigma-70 family RNA polymerase sigma factor [Frankiales bacterium]|nr:sigma-70 family RNA polymerase sigma factor [Frankiales bacterium]
MSEDTALSALVERARAGERDAVEQLVAAMRPPIYRYVLSRLLDPHLADDVTQEVMVTMVTALSRYVDQGRPFGAWVFGIAGNKVSESRRSASRRRESASAILPDQPADHALEPEAAVVRLEASARVAALLETLPHQQAEVLRLRIAAGLSAEETAAVLGMTPGAVRVAQHRALARLRATAEVAS